MKIWTLYQTGSLAQEVAIPQPLHKCVNLLNVNKSDGEY